MAKNNAICPKCKKGFRMGRNGTVDGCDECTGTKRDKNGFAWYPRERVHIYQDVGTGEEIKVKRADAFQTNEE